MQKSLNSRAPQILSVPVITSTPTVGVDVAYTQASVSGPGSMVRTRQWQLDGTNKTGETDLTYTPVTEDIGKELRVIETIKNQFGTTQTSSTSIVVVTDVVSTAPSVTTNVVLLGNPQVGASSSFTTAVVSGTPTPTRTSIQWTLDDVNISGATSSTYTPGAGDATHTLKVIEVWTNSQGSITSTSLGKTVAAAAVAFPFSPATALTGVPVWVGARGHTADAGEVDSGLTPSGSGVKYYIDSVNGNDSWTGLSGTFTSGSTGPWKTLGKVLEKTLAGYWDTVAPNNNTVPAQHPIWTPAPSGSIFLFARGGTYTGSIRVYSTFSGGVSQTQTNLTFGAYGSGARPNINFVEYGETVYTRVQTGTGNGTLGTVTPNQYPTTLVNSQKWTLTATSSSNFTVSGSLSGVQAAATVGTPYDNGIVAFTITAGGTPFIAGDKITFDVIRWGYNTSTVWANSRQVTVRNLKIVGDYQAKFAAAGANESLAIYNQLKSVSGVQLRGPNDGSVSSSLINCEVTDFGGDGASGGGLLLIQNCYVHHTKLNNKYVTGSGVGVGFYYAQILGNTISYNGYSKLLAHGIYTGGKGLVIQGNKIFGNSNLGWVCHGVEDGMVCVDNDIYENGNGIHIAWANYGTYEEMSNTLIERNYIYSNGTNGQGFGFACNAVTNIQFRNNVLFNNNAGCVSIGGAGDSGAGLNVSETRGVHIYGNTLIQLNNGYVVAIGNNDARTKNVQVKGNIFYSGSPSATLLRMTGTIPQNQIDTNGNVFYAPFNTTSKVVSWFGTTYTRAEFNTATSREALGKQGDPSFTNFGTEDYTLQGGSIAKAIALPVGLTNDYVDAARSGTTPSSGAYE